eukprot:scaffold1687_cov405-Prasinococcus_capsulatus_cf.AAC.15
MASVHSDHSVLEHHQFPTDGCTARKWLVAVPPTQAGLLSDFHTLQVGMLIAARLGRTFVLEGEVQRRKLGQYNVPAIQRFA